MLGVLLYVSYSLVRWNTYMMGRLVYAGGILVLLGETVTTTNDRRQRWTRVFSLSLSFLVRPIKYINTRVLPETIMSSVYLA